VQVNDFPNHLNISTNSLPTEWSDVMEAISTPKKLSRIRLQFATMHHSGAVGIPHRDEWVDLASVSSQHNKDDLKFAQKTLECFGLWSFECEDPHAIQVVRACDAEFSDAGLEISKETQSKIQEWLTRFKRYNPEAKGLKPAVDVIPTLMAWLNDAKIEIPEDLRINLQALVTSPAFFNSEPHSRLSFFLERFIQIGYGCIDHPYGGMQIDLQLLSEAELLAGRYPIKLYNENGERKDHLGRHFNYVATFKGVNKGDIFSVMGLPRARAIDDAKQDRFAIWNVEYRFIHEDWNGRDFSVLKIPKFLQESEI
jgi:hypothetical protein